MVKKRKKKKPACWAREEAFAPPSGPRSRLHCPQGAPWTSPPAGALSAALSGPSAPILRRSLPPQRRGDWRLNSGPASSEGWLPAPQGPGALRSPGTAFAVRMESAVPSRIPLPQGSLLQGRAAPFTSASQRLAPPGHNTQRRCVNDVTPCRLLLLESWGETKLRSLVFVGFQSRLCPTASSRPSCPLPPGPGPHPHPGPVDHTVL